MSDLGVLLHATWPTVAAAGVLVWILVWFVWAGVEQRHWR
jgi:hypothetical protein